MEQADKEQGALIVGGGIAGMAAGMQLADLGHVVALLDSAPAFGGSMHLLDHTFPTDSCGLCLMLPRQPALCPTLELERQEKVRLLPYTELVGVEGEAGAFRVRVRHKARYVDGELCTGCGLCGDVCPESRPHDHEGWLRPVKAIYRPAGLRAVPDTWLVDMGYCTRCGLCVEACPEGAIDLEMEAVEEQVEAGAVLLTPGYGAFDARLKGEYGYGVYDNVVTSLEFERLVSLAGSGVGRPWRPSGGEALVGKKVAFVQCVGSRDNLCGAGYCSSACCMYTAKQVRLAKEAEPGLEVTVFYMDIRASGKGYERYIERVQGLPGVEYRRSMPSSLHQREQTRDLVVTYVGEDGKLREEEYGLVVLAVGLAPPEGMGEVTRQLGVTLNEYGFAESDGYHPGRTNQPGVFAAGAYREPKDIPDTVVDALSAAAEVAAFLGDLGTAQDAEPGETLVELRDVSEEEPKVGVFVCSCNGELSGLDVGQVLSSAASQPGVAVAREVTGGCTEGGRAALADVIEAEGLNRVVLAGCSPRLHGDELEDLMRGVGLDPRLMARVNLREQAVYPHPGNGNGQTEVATSLVGMAVAGLRAMNGVASLSEGSGWSLTPGAVVVGGGAGGMAAAVELAALGIHVDLVEREGELGGQWHSIRYQPDTLNEGSGKDPQGALAALVARVEEEERVRVHLGAELKALEGGPGRYRSLIVGEEKEEQVEHGVLVVATGGKPVETTSYLYGRHEAVVTQRELEEELAGPGGGPRLDGLKRVVMIQCVDSREPEREYCSRVCCTQAVKNALKVKELAPEVEVYVLYREVRTYGFREKYYQEARDAGVVFVRYELPARPEVRAEGKGLVVSLVEPVTGQEIELATGLLVLSVGIEARDERGLAEVLGVELDGDGFFAEEHGKMKPLDLGREGVYVAGLAHSPRFLEEAIGQGQGVAMRVAGYLSPGEKVVEPSSVWVNERLCSFCGLCEEACPYGGRVMNEERRVAEVDYGQCRGCGVCAMVCPNKATLQKTLEHRQLLSAIDMALN